MRDAVEGGGRVYRLAHGWRLSVAPGVGANLAAGWIRPAVRPVPPAMARQLGGCRISLVEELSNPRLASEWTEADGCLEISIATSARGEHEVAMEVLLCLGQALWTKLDSRQHKAYWLLLDREIGAGVTGEIDEHGLKQKRLLLAGVHSATSARRLERYGAASFAGTAAEYVHSLWHDVSVRRGRDFLPAPRLKARLELLARWFPPAPGCRLFPPAETAAPGETRYTRRRSQAS